MPWLRVLKYTSNNYLNDMSMTAIKTFVIPALLTLIAFFVAFVALVKFMPQFDGSTTFAKVAATIALISLSITALVIALYYIKKALKKLSAFPAQFLMM